MTKIHAPVPEDIHDNLDNSPESSESLNPIFSLRDHVIESISSQYRVGTFAQVFETIYSDRNRDYDFFLSKIADIDNIPKEEGKYYLFVVLSDVFYRLREGNKVSEQYLNAIVELCNPDRLHHKDVLFVSPLLLEIARESEEAIPYIDTILSRFSYVSSEGEDTDISVPGSLHSFTGNRDFFGMSLLYAKFSRFMSACAQNNSIWLSDDLRTRLAQEFVAKTPMDLDEGDSLENITLSLLQQGGDKERIEHVLELTLPIAPFWKEISLLGIYFSACNQQYEDTGIHRPIPSRFIDFFNKRAESVRAYMQENAEITQWQREKLLLQIGNIECLILENNLQMSSVTEREKYEKDMYDEIVSSLQNIKKAFTDSCDPENIREMGKDIQSMFSILINIALRNHVDIPWKQYLKEFGLLSGSDISLWKEEQEWADDIAESILAVETIARTNTATDVLERIEKFIESYDGSNGSNFFLEEEHELKELFMGPKFSERQIIFIVQNFETVCGVYGSWEKRYALFYLLKKRSEKKDFFAHMPAMSPLGKSPLVFFESNELLLESPTAPNLADFMGRATHRGAYFAPMDNIEHLPSTFDTVLSGAISSHEAEKLAESVLLYSSVTRDGTYLKYIPSIIGRVSSYDRDHLELAYLSAGIVCREFFDVSKKFNALEFFDEKNLDKTEMLLSMMIVSAENETDIETRDFLLESAYAMMSIRQDDRPYLRKEWIDTFAKFDSNEEHLSNIFDWLFCKKGTLDIFWNGNSFTESTHPRILRIFLSRFETDFPRIFEDKVREAGFGYLSDFIPIFSRFKEQLPKSFDYFRDKIQNYDISLLNEWNLPDFIHTFIQLFPDVSPYIQYKDSIKTLGESSGLDGRIPLLLRLHKEVGGLDTGLEFAQIIQAEKDQPFDKDESRSWFQGLFMPESETQQLAEVSPLRSELFLKTWDDPSYAHPDALGAMIRTACSLVSCGEIRNVIMPWFLGRIELFSLEDAIDGCSLLFKHMMQQEQEKILAFFLQIQKNQDKNTSNFLTLSTHLYDWYSTIGKKTIANILKNELIEIFLHSEMKVVSESWNFFSINITRHEGSDEVSRILKVLGWETKDPLDISHDIMKCIKDGEFAQAKERAKMIVNHPSLQYIHAESWRESLLPIDRKALISTILGWAEQDIYVRSGSQKNDEEVFVCEKESIRRRERFPQSFREKICFLRDAVHSDSGEFGDLSEMLREMDLPRESRSERFVDLLVRYAESDFEYIKRMCFLEKPKGTVLTLEEVRALLGTAE